MTSTLTVALGGAIGAALRHHVAGLVSAPWGTLTVNVVGSLLMGALVGWLAGTQSQLRLLLGVGVLGGFTTFSAFSLDAVRLLEARSYGTFTAYVGLSVGASLAALFVGLLLARSLA